MTEYYDEIAFWIFPDALPKTALLELARLNDIVDVRLDTLEDKDGDICLKARFSGRMGDWVKVRAFCKGSKTITIDYDTTVKLMCDKWEARTHDRVP